MFNGVYSKDSLPKTQFNYKMKVGAYIINLDKFSEIEMHWIAFYAFNKNVTFFDSFGVEHIPKEIMKFIGNKSLKTNIFRIQAFGSIMCGYFCIGFIDFMLKGKSLTYFINPFSTNNFKKMII